jgi:hypothetical protein
MILRYKFTNSVSKTIISSDSVIIDKIEDIDLVHKWLKSRLLYRQSGRMHFNDGLIDYSIVKLCDEQSQALSKEVLERKIISANLLYEDWFISTI